MKTASLRPAACGLLVGGLGLLGAVLRRKRVTRHHGRYIVERAIRAEKGPKTFCRWPHGLSTKQDERASRKKPDSRLSGLGFLARLSQHQGNLAFAVLVAHAAHEQGVGLGPCVLAALRAGEFRLAGLLRLGLLACRCGFPVKLKAGRLKFGEGLAQASFVAG
jgi:hypothetical protein